MRFLLSVLCLVLLSVCGIHAEGEQQMADAGGYAAGSPPSKLSLGTQFMNLPSQNQPQQTMFAQPAPIKSLAAQTLPSQTLPAQQGSILQTQNLPVITTETSETLPVQTLQSLQATYLQPNYRQQLINQEVIQPVMKTQPVLQVRHITQNVYQPTLQKQPVIQPVITQPILHRVIHNQPIIQQQLQQQTVVKRRVINQPQIVQRLQTQYQTAPQQTMTEYGQQYPTQTLTNAKVAALSAGFSGNSPNSPAADPSNFDPSADDDMSSDDAQ